MVTESTVDVDDGPDPGTGRPSLAPGSVDHRGVLWWRFARRPVALSSASVGGGRTRPHWLVNIGVPLDYARTDLGAHVREVTRDLGLVGAGVALFTAADVTRVRHAEHRGAQVWATVGITKPTWAADPSGGFTPWSPGTINVVVTLPVLLEPGAMVNAVITVTEAKTQALLDAGVPGTGTASDAVVILCDADAAGPGETFGGPRSRWGSALAVATHTAVLAGAGGAS